MRPIFCKLLKTNIEKMSVFRLSIMLMKTQELRHSLHDVDENKGERYLRPWRKVLADGYARLPLAEGDLI
jgi:hypothetical protein